MRRMLLLATVVLFVGLAACGADNAADDVSNGKVAGEEFPVTIAAANGDVTIEERPSRIVSLSPTATEMLFAIDAGDQVIAVDDNSNYPADAPTTDLSGFEPNVEAITTFDPDLIVIADDTAGLSAALEKVGTPVLSMPAATTLDDTYTQIEQLGTATEHEEAAASLTASMQTEIQKIVDSMPDFETAPTYYHELDDLYFSATSDTFIGQVYSLLGLQNIADPADTDGSGFPQLSAEFIVDADPDLIFLADTKCCDQSEQTVASRPGWNQITAVTSGGVVELDDDIASRWGPRIVDFLRTVADRVAPS